MAISEHERRVLEEIEHDLATNDPAFVSRVRNTDARSSRVRRRVAGAILFLGGLAILVLGLAVTDTMIGHFPVLSLFGFLAMYAGAVVAIVQPQIPIPRLPERAHR